MYPRHQGHRPRRAGEPQHLAVKGKPVADKDLPQAIARGWLFFHADPHPGNLLIMQDGRIAFFDFGMVGRITSELQAKMIDAFFHVVGKDPAGIAQDLIDLDFLKPGTPPSTIKPVVERMFEFHFNLKLTDVNFKELTYDLADVMYGYPFRLPSILHT
ncbi:MAG: AarF/ABC1/UbiB kinase family protein [Chloracidobacterium sp.]|nr:AarF/ABC1/UbiB kinase family protein [Chloracidobacterium sp.]